MRWDSLPCSLSHIFRRWWAVLLPISNAVIGAILGVAAAVMTLACGLLTKERLKPKRAEKFFFHQFADLVHNKAWLYMTAIAVCTNFFNGFRYAVAGYMFDYCLHGNVTIED